MKIDLKKYPVLFVDDEPNTVIGFERQYKKEFQIHTATDPKTALSLLQAHPEVAVILSDQRMPEMRGVDFLALTGEIVPAAVKMLITAYADVAVVIDAINKGNVYRYLTKPYHEADLRYAIIQAIEHYHLVAERDRLHAEKLEAMKAVARSNRLASIGILAAGMAHEINNPLVAISSFLQMMPKKLEKPDDAEYWVDFYQTSVDETRRIKELIAKLLAYSRTAASAELCDKAADLTAPVDLNRLVEEVAVFFKSEAQNGKNEIVLSLDPNLPIGKMDREKMRQVIVNLVFNAIQATRSGTVTLRTSSDCDEKGITWIEMTVSDTGAGIQEEALEQLFNPFLTTEAPHPGPGLGLTACHHIVEQHRGKIEIRSKKGIGTTVIVRIPADPASHERRKEERRK
ncbi:MAG: ATP-binding protein [Candidatus Manganitrophaceae bacterium]